MRNGSEQSCASLRGDILASIVLMMKSSYDSFCVTTTLANMQTVNQNHGTDKDCICVFLASALIFNHPHPAGRVIG